MMAVQEKHSGELVVSMGPVISEAFHATKLWLSFDFAVPPAANQILADSTRLMSLHDSLSHLVSTHNQASLQEEQTC